MVYEIKLQILAKEAKLEQNVFVLHKNKIAIIIETDKSMVKIKQFNKKHVEVLSYTKTLANKVLTPVTLQCVTKDGIVIPEEKLLTNFKQKVLTGIIDENTELILPVKGDLNLDLNYINIMISKKYSLTAKNIVNLVKATIEELSIKNKDIYNKDLNYDITGIIISKLKANDTNNQQK